MAAKNVGAKHLGLYADNPVRYCNLRGQVEGVPGNRAQQQEDDIQLRPDRIQQVAWWLAGLGLLAVAAGSGLHLNWFEFAPLSVTEPAVTAVIVTGGAVALLGMWEGVRRGRIRRTGEICRIFNVEPDQYKLIAASILGNRGRIFEAHGVSAIPHVVFQRRSGHRSYHVGLYLSRKYTGKVHDSDLFRLTLHMGIVRRAMGVRMVSGSIRYAGKHVKVAYSDSLYRSLVSMGPEYLRSVKRWWPENRLSLRHRQKVAAGEAIRTKSTDFPEEYMI